MRNIEIGSDGRGIIIESSQTPDYVLPLMINAASDTRADAGAVSVATYYTNVTTTGAAAITLADGLINGQLKKIQMTVDLGDATLTLASAASSSLDVITFADVGDFVLLMWFDQDDDGAGYWRILEAGNAADGVTAPAIA